ncbi:hypothetical protein Tco_0315930 [Tanacetum coccineum]
MTLISFRCNYIISRIIPITYSDINPSLIVNASAVFLFSSYTAAGLGRYILCEIVPQLAERATNGLIERNLKPIVADTIIQERDAFQDAVLALIYKEFDAQAPQIIEELFKQYMKRSLQDQANDPALWEVLKRKFEKSSTSNTSCRDDDSQHHDDHQEDDAPPKGEKRVKKHKTSKISKSIRGSSSKQSAKDSTTYVSKQQHQQQEWDAWEEETVIDKDEVIPEDETPELITEFQNV